MVLREKESAIYSTCLGGSLGRERVLFLPSGKDSRGHPQDEGEGIIL